VLKFVPALDGYVDPSIHPLLMLIVLILALLTGIAGAFYPAIYAMRVRPVEALRFE
jgi:putative ABC transport system permease protein